MADEHQDSGLNAQRSGMERDAAVAAASAGAPMTLWVRLNKHKVVQWTLAYGAAAYTLLHAVEMVSSALDWPHVVVRIATLLLLLGVPVVTTLAWFHGYRAQHRVSGPELAVLTVLLVLASGVLWFLGRPSHERTPATVATQSPAPGGVAPVAIRRPPERSIAVLPFVDMSPGKDQEYFSDGLSEELLNLLTKVPELRVAARTSSFAFKGKAVDVATVAQRLNVTHLLEGSVRKSGDRVRITAQLIKADDGYHVWSETYERTLKDVFAVQDEIAAAVVSRLQVTLLGPLPKARETDPRAYSLYLKAHQLTRQGTAKGWEQAIGLYQQALAIDPAYALAWDGLARTYNNQVGKGLRPADGGYRLAREAAARAVAIDPGSAQAHIRLAWIAMSYDRDLAAAARHIERALALEPANPGAANAAAALAQRLGRLEESVALQEHTLARDPLNPTQHGNLGVGYFRIGRLDESIASFRTALTLSPDYIGAQYSIGLAQLFKGDRETALATMRLERTESWRLIGVAMVCHSLGQEAASDAALKQLIDKYGRDWPYNIAYVFAWRGDADRAFKWLDKAVASKDAGLIGIVGDPSFANIHNDPRWPAFLKKIGRSKEQLDAIKFDVKLPE